MKTILTGLTKDVHDLMDTLTRRLSACKKSDALSWEDIDLVLVSAIDLLWLYHKARGEQLLGESHYETTHDAVEREFGRALEAFAQIMLEENRRRYAVQIDR